MIKGYLLAFIPIFVAVDAIGVLPIFASLTQGCKKKEKSQIIVSSMFTALILAVGFVFLGKAIFRILGIALEDFMIAGGIVLFSIAIIDILNPGKRRRIPAKEVSAVPLGFPLIVGPAVLTTSLILTNEYGIFPTLASLVINIGLAGAIFFSSDLLLKMLSENGSRALSKVTHLFLAAIAIMLIRKGIAGIFNSQIFSVY